MTSTPSHTSDVDLEAEKNAALWLEGSYDGETKETVRQLLRNTPQEAIDSFYTTLSFGTGGMRGIMGVGSNRINEYTIRAATQGLANYINQQPFSGKLPEKRHSVFIGFDSRHYSKQFAVEAAKVFAGNGIQVYLCDELRPTPLVSFGCRFLRCTAAVMITASHNPPQYNGYKVYWSDGGQVLPPHDGGIIQEVNLVTDPAMVQMTPTVDHPLIISVADEIDATYITECCKLQHYPKENGQHGNELKVVYTSLHGAGITLIPGMLSGWGFSNITYVDQQIIPDGDFPTVNYPNPEIQSALELGIEKLKETEGDVLIATDPDADRVGVVVRHHNECVQLDGNKIASILLAHICEALVANGKMPPQGVFVKTIVTTELFRSICEAYGRPCIDVLSGFKYIAGEILKWENSPNGHSFIFGGEDSCGYLLGTLARDKDGIIAAALICEAALHAKRQGKTLVDLLHDLYRNHGVYAEDILSIDFNESKEGKDNMKAGMLRLRQHLPTQINGIDVACVDDYQTAIKKDLKTGKTEKLILPQSDVLTFWLADGTKIVVRPSGTEPKIKLYCGLFDKSTHKSIDVTEKNCRKRLAAIMDEIRKLTQ
ncbi:MAG: phospho-sugar mutase [Parachlamydiaceae bacterium]